MRKLTDALFKSDQSLGQAGQPVEHDSARRQVAGSARYIDDMPEPAGLLHAAVGQADVAHGTLKSLQLDAVRTAAGVQRVISVADVPGHTDIGAVFGGDPVLAEDTILFHGQPLFAVAADSYEQARLAVKAAQWEIEPGEAILSVDQARAVGAEVGKPVHFRHGDADATLKNAPHQLSGRIQIGGQEHFYLEGQASLVIPEEDGGMLVYTSSQHPSEVQKLVAEVLGISFNKVTVDVRRMGGAFGGKESQAAQWACIAALLAHHTGRPVKIRLPRSVDMSATGKRHPFDNRWQLGFDDHGVIQAAKMEVNGFCGYSPDLSNAIVDRAMFHTDNAYFLGDSAIDGYRCLTHTVSNTAFRGFGGPQGMMTIEAAMDDIARHRGEDPLTIRKRNLYGQGERDVTPYQMTVEDNILPQLIERLETTSDYWQRRQAITEFNKTSPIIKKGLALTPVKFGISFTAKHLNQAGALVHIYTDGSIHLNHGGTEMGQGLFTKVAQIVALEFDVALETVQVSATRTDKVPNTSPTAASSGTDLNGKAAQNAARAIKQRLIEFACDHYGLRPDEVRFHAGKVTLGDNVIDFADLVQSAYLNRISLSATGYYRTPKLEWDAENGTGRPFLYFAYGASCSEVSIDTLTGEYSVDRVDVLHDVGDSINPALDIGQIEGGFIQGMGWLTSEELKWDDSGRLLSNSPANYKIPAIGDTPPVFNVDLFPQPNREDTVFKSKAVGEPPLMLPISVWCALRDAIASVSDYQLSPALDTPATPERVLFAIEALKGRPS
ncbi:xanthine dehydrogenase molybdopterin binding subunit [Saccharospirillum sp. MSK14-1]|uniref:xanthine dehydrogenase molybdopterin binding subunit n=1 Tax=Saccharospirillum sp. MSK14-1 TaxID=1897632 RepID=UPI000D3D166B|nr:xanthine dehydrogenase molybdopterin binding subunit [Saccharospirillum sp. MSK14-1]PTY38612.1 xanthine dehydrogenase molybdopterin binding subunit [Saccharospirillum sp. MSK14-1]